MNNPLKKKQFGICLLNQKNIKLYFFSNTLNKKFISKLEEGYSNNLSEKRRQEYTLSRSCMRIALSQIFKMHPLKIPIDAPPSRPPILKKGYGFVSLSHCIDAVVVGWSNSEIGIDIERRDRKINFNVISNKIFTPKEIQFFSDILNNNDKNLRFLEYWVIKESLLKREKDSLFRSINKWSWDYDSKKAFNISRKKQVEVKKINYQEWIIGLANSSKKN